MLYETAYQALEAPLMILSGMCMTAAAMLFRGLRRLICAGTWLSLICDAAMGLIWSIIFCTALTIASRGVLRLYHILCTAAGAALFRAAFGIPVIKICAFVQRTCEKLCRKLKRNRLMRALLR